MQIAAKPFHVPRGDFRALLEEGDVLTLLMVLVHFTGENEWLDLFSPYIRPVRTFSTSIPAELADRLRDRLSDLFTRVRNCRPGSHRLKS